MKKTNVINFMQSMQEDLLNKRIKEKIAEEKYNNFSL